MQSIPSTRFNPPISVSTLAPTATLSSAKTPGLTVGDARPDVFTPSTSPAPPADLAHAQALFQHHSQPADLFKLAETLGVKVYSGETDWVNKLCQDKGVEAFVFTPHSKRYGDAIENTRENTSKNTDKTSSPADAAFEALSQARKQGLFVKANASRDIIIHELYHVLQDKAGLPFGVNQAADTQAEHIDNALNPPTLDAVLMRLKLLGKIALNPKQALSTKEPQTPVAQALFRKQQREAEVDQFLITNSTTLGLSDSTRLKHLAHYLTETRFKLAVSQLLEHDPALADELARFAKA